MRLLLAVLAAFGLALTPPPAQAEAIEFDVTLAGLRAAVLTVEAEESGSRYAVAARIATTGALALLRPVRFEAEAAGRLASDRPRPDRFREDVDTGRRQSNARLAWKGGVPQPADGSAPGPKGAVDPLSALFAGLRDRADPCALAFTVFDGTRLAKVALAPAPSEDPAAGAVCTGRFTRLSGYPADEIAKRRAFDFTVRHEALPDGRHRVLEVETETAFGRALLRRR